MMNDITASKTQINYILRAQSRAERSGDMNVWMKCQGLTLYFTTEIGLSGIATSLSRDYETVRQWVIDFVTFGAKCIIPRIRTGRQPKLSREQRRTLYTLLQQKPCDLGFLGGCWTSAVVQLLIKDRFGVDYAPKYIPELLKQIGLSFQRAKFESSHLDPVKRKAWLEETWPKIRKMAKETNALVFFEDEASFAMWGSLFYTWAPRGKQPVVKTNGKRKSLKVFGAIEASSGRLIYQAIEGKLNAESYIEFLSKLLRETRQNIIIVHDGSSYHTAKGTKDFIATKDRLTTFRLPPYSPDFNPIEGLWKKIKKAATHLVYFPDFGALESAVKNALADFVHDAASVLKLFGFYRKLKAL